MTRHILPRLLAMGKWFLYAGTIASLALLPYLLWKNHKDLKAATVSKEMQHLMLTAEATAVAMGGYFNERKKNVQAQANDTLIQKGLSERNITSAVKEEVHETFEAYANDIRSIYLLDAKGGVLHREPESSTVSIGKSYAHKQGVSFVLEHHKSYISEIFNTDSGKRVVSVLSPVHYNGRFVGISRWLIGMDTISDKYLASINMHDDGFAQVLDKNGSVLIHPNPEYTGKRLLGVESKHAPQHGRSDMDTVIERFPLGKGISAILNSTEGNDSSSTKSIVSFAPVSVGDQLWYIGISHGYAGVEDELGKNLENTIQFSGLLALIFAVGAYHFLRMQRNRAILETEKETEERATKEWESTFNAIGDMIVIVNRDRRIARANKSAMERIPDIHSNSPCYEIFHGVETLPTTCVSCNAFKTRKPVSSEYYDPRLKSWFNLLVYPIMDSDDEVLQLIHVFMDITQHRAQLEEKEKLQLQLQRSEKMEAIGTLAGGVAHDLNNVLSGIVSYPELILMDIPEEDVKLRKQIKTFQKSGEKAAAIVQDLLTLARRGVVTNDVMNLNDVIEDYLQSRECDVLKIHHPDVTIKVNLRKDLPNVLGSSVHLSKTIMNLASNAAEAITGKGTIIISSDHRYVDKSMTGFDQLAEGSYVVIGVADDGIGIAEEHINKIFEPFYTKKKMGRSGTGLGLAVVWSTIEDHNGHIDVRSEQGRGTTFTLYLPVSRKDTVERTTTGSIEDYIGEGSILVVDDVEEQQTLYG